MQRQLHLPTSSPALLRELDVLVVDCQSTGASPKHGVVLELGWARTNPSEEEPTVCSSLLELPEGVRISRQITRVTGIGHDDLDAAVPPSEAWRALRRDWLAHAIIHYARFELAFLRDLARRHEPELGALPFSVICTHDVTRRLHPDLPRRSLRAIAGYYGFPVELLRRSAGHVAATAHVWRHLLDALAERDVHSWDELTSWLQETPAPRSRRKGYPMSRDKRLSLPDAPGVYRMLRKNGDVLYVGKARSLKKRVNSYFTKQRNINERTLEMLTQARDLDVTVTATPLEAALLESDEIKEREPPYNVALGGETRLAWFANDDLSDAAAAPDDDFRLGPLPNRLSLRPLGALCRALAGQVTEDDLGARALGVPRRFGPDGEGFAAGLALFRARHGLRGEPRSALTRLAHQLWPYKEVERDDDDSERAWDPERIARHLERATAGAGQLIRRARWLCLLCEATVAWQEPDEPAQRMLRIEGGQIVERGYVSPESPLPAPSRSPSQRERQAVFDITTYDRLRVLGTELTRIIRAGEVTIRLSPTTQLSGRKLRRVLELT